MSFAREDISEQEGNPGLMQMRYIALMFWIHLITAFSGHKQKVGHAKTIQQSGTFHILRGALIEISPDLDQASCSGSYRSVSCTVAIKLCHSSLMKCFIDRGEWYMSEHSNFKD